ERLEKRAKWCEEKARKSELELGALGLVVPGTLVDITTRAGVMLGWTEDLASDCDRLTAVATAPGSSGLDPPRPVVRSQTMTVVATARDHVDQARGELDNMKDVLASLTRKVLFLQMLGLATLYILFHPIALFPFWKVPASFRPQWEIFFWSLFGAITI